MNITTQMLLATNIEGCVASFVSKKWRGRGAQRSEDRGGRLLRSRLGGNNFLSCMALKLLQECLLLVILNQRSLRSHPTLETTQGQTDGFFS